MTDLWATKSEDVGLILRPVSFQDFQPMWSWSTNVTDGQTDDMRSQDRALHYSASRGKSLVVYNIGLLRYTAIKLTNIGRFLTALLKEW